jgi:hypothetical protein
VIAAGLSDPVLITIVVGLWLLLLALIALTRAILGKSHEAPHRLRVGVFIERDRGDRKPPQDDETDDPTKRERRG